MFKIMNNEAPNYLLNLIRKSKPTVTTRNNHIPNYHCKTDSFKYAFFRSALKDWFNLNASVRNSKSLTIFKSRLLSFIRPIQSNIYVIFDPIGLKLLTRLCLYCSHLNKHKFRHNFQDCLNLLCFCSLEIEDTVHYLLHSHNFSQYCFDPTNTVKSISDDFESFSDNVKAAILLYGDSRLVANKNKLILEAIIIHIKKAERFSGSLFG